MNPIDDYRSTHDLCDVLPQTETLTVQLTDGDAFDVSGCWPIDYSIYQLRGGWSCTVEEYLGSSDKKKRLFRPRSGIELSKCALSLVELALTVNNDSCCFDTC